MSTLCSLVHWLKGRELLEMGCSSDDTLLNSIFSVLLAGMLKGSVTPLVIIISKGSMRTYYSGFQVG